MFIAEQRLKEIGIRKVLGATVSSLFGLLSSEFLLLIVTALLVASPVVWFVMNNWLQSFAYRMPIPWWIFAVAGSLIIFIAMATISFQIIKAAVANPVKSLKNE
jgi:ABC-type antimicrobial peptide transport system permease subunit